MKKIEQLLQKGQDPFGRGKIIQFLHEHKERLEKFLTDRIPPVEKPVEEDFKPFVMGGIPPPREALPFYMAGVVYYAINRKECLEASQNHRKYRTEFYRLIIAKLEMILLDPLFCNLGGIPIIGVENRIKGFRKLMKTFQTQRGSSVKELKRYLKPLIYYLEKQGLNRAERVNFVFDLLVEFDAAKIIFQDKDDFLPRRRRLEAEAIQARYGGAPTGEINVFVAKGRIWKWNEEVMRAYKNKASYPTWHTIFTVEKHHEIT